MSVENGDKHHDPLAMMNGHNHNNGDDPFAAISSNDAPDLLGFGDATSNKEDDPADDDFGDFGEAPKEQIPVVNGSHEPTTNDDDDDDDFGDFAAPQEEDTNGLQSSSSVPEEVPPINLLEPVEDATENDVFGSLGAEPPVLNGTFPAHDFDTPPAEEAAVSDDGDDTLAEEDVDFDNFGLVEGTPAASENGDATDQDLMTTKSVPQEAVATDDDFGDFGGFKEADGVNGTAASVTPVVEPAQPETPEEDDFGDFGDFNDAPVVETTPPVVESSESAPVVQTTPPPVEATASDDDFGDFGDFNDAPAVTETAPQEPAVVEDDFGDFGDFNDAPAATPAPVQPPAAASNDDDDFGDFGDFSNTSTEPTRVAAPPVVQQQQQQQQQLLQDPFMDRAKGIFTQVFGHNLSNDDSVDQAVDPAMTIGDVLDELHKSEEQKTSEGTTDWANERLTSVLSSINMITESESKVIFDALAVYPYAHYSQPIPEFENAMSSAVMESPRQRGTLSFDFTSSMDDTAAATDTTAAPELDNSGGAADLPPAADVKLDFTDFKAKPLEKDASGAAPATATSNSTTRSMNSDAKLFLAQIPDLSFMLSSTLSLRKKE